MADPKQLLYSRHVETRQQQTAQILSEAGLDGLLIHSGSPVNHFLDDQGPPFRSNPHFTAWLPLPRHPDCALLIRPGRKPRLWYYQPDDFWHVPPPTPEAWWADSVELEICREPAAWRRSMSGAGALAVIGDAPGLSQGLDRADLNPEALIRKLHEHRTVKTAWERHLMMEANQRAVHGHLAARKAFREGRDELSIHLAYLAAVEQPERQLPYGNIVGLNEHAAVLHYQHQSPVAPREHRTLLIDAGADSLGYASDITRTTTTDEDIFGSMVAALDDGQQRLVDQVRPGESYIRLHQETHCLIGAILQKFDIVRMEPEAMVEAGITRTFLPHGLGHFIGVQVHDVAGLLSPDGRSLPPPEEYPALRLTRELQPGNVVTIEPGLYFIPALLDKLRAGSHRDAVDWALVDKLIPFGGIRIEDDVLVTEADPVNFTRQAFDKAAGAEL